MMQAALAIANDNIPALQNVEPVDAHLETPAVSEKNSVRAHAVHTAAPTTRLDPVILVIGMWLALGAVAAFALPFTLGVVPLVSMIATVLLTIAAVRPRSTAILALATLVLAGGAIASFATAQTPLPLLIIGVWTAGMWAVQIALAARWRSTEVALIASAGVIAVALYLLGTVETALSALPIIASGGMVMLGLSRMGVKSALPTAEIHYAIWWSALIGCALIVQNVYPDLPRPTQTVAVASAVLAAAAAFTWSMERGLSVLTGLAIIAAFTLIYNASVMDKVTSESLVAAQLVVPAVFGAGVFAAGLAMCIRGLKRAETPTMLLGAGAMLVEALIIGRTALVEPELTGLTVVMAGLFSLWLGALRS